MCSYIGLVAPQFKSDNIFRRGYEISSGTFNMSMESCNAGSEWGIGAEKRTEGEFGGGE